MVRGSDLVRIARTFIGVPYQTGGYAPVGMTPTGFDCALLLLRCSQGAGLVENSVRLQPYPKFPRPRDFEQLKQFCDAVPLAEAQPGDVLVMRNPFRPGRLWHLGMKTDRGIIWVHPLPEIGVVTESAIGLDMARHLIAAWRFKGVELG